MKKLFKLTLQFFGGEGAAAGEGTSTSGENATVDAGQRLRELGVPEDKIRRRAKYNTANTDKAGVKAVSETVKAEDAKEEQDAAAEDNPTEEKAEAPKRLSWDEIMADPEYNKQMQSVVQSRLKSAKGAEEALGKMTPALEVLARKHGLDPANIDYDKLAQAINNDSDYYEDKALEMGVPVETAKKIDQQERDAARAQREQARTIEEQKVRNHFTRLETQAEEMKKTFPTFDLQKELQNPAFFRMTSPQIGLSIEDAYYAVHRNEIQTAAMKATAEATAQKISNSIRANAQRPDEAGSSAQAASVTTFDYSKASPAQREAFKKDLRARMARGEKVYPGQR